MKTVYRTKYYEVKRDDSRPTPRYLVYSGERIVYEAGSQVAATMWVSRQKKGGAKS